MAADWHGPGWANKPASCWANLTILALVAERLAIQHISMVEHLRSSKTVQDLGELMKSWSLPRRAYWLEKGIVGLPW